MKTTDEKATPLRCYNCCQPMQPGESTCPNCGRKVEGPESTPKGVDKLRTVDACALVGWLSLIVGVLLIVTGFASIAYTPDAGTWIALATGCSLLPASVFWFALGHIVKFLAEIARSVKKES